MNGSFEPLYHAERLHMVNPEGDIGLVTLWSPWRSAKRRLEEISPELLDPERSRIAVIANLYGDGMYAMLCNLLFNPQVRHLIAVGQDLELPTCEELEAFIEHGLEDAELLGAPVKRIAGTARIFPAIEEFDERCLRDRLSFAYLGRLSGESLPSELMRRVRELPRTHPGENTSERVRVALDANGHGGGGPDASMRRPSGEMGHEVMRRGPLECWEELVVRTVRFGRAVKLGNGPRLELLNVKAVIAEPARESAQALEKHGFQLESLLAYEAKMMQPELPEETSYTYGNRLRAHFPQGQGERMRGDERRLDALQAAIERLRASPETRRAYISLWDNSLDLPGEPNLDPDEPNLDLAGEPHLDLPWEPDAGAGAPCLTTIFFRKVGDALSLTATYRAHNLLTAWLRNVYGLMAIQRHVAADCGLGIGQMTVISHSLGVDPSSPHFPLAQALSENWKRDDDRNPETGKYSLREDPNGYFVVSVDEQQRCIVAEHRFRGVLIKRYRGERADALTSEIAADMAVSLVSHGLWLGRELARHETILRETILRDGDPLDRAL